MGNTHREVPQSDAAIAVWVHIPAVMEKCGGEVTAPQASECSSEVQKSMVSVTLVSGLQACCTFLWVMVTTSSSIATEQSSNAQAEPALHSRLNHYSKRAVACFSLLRRTTCACLIGKRFPLGLCIASSQALDS